MCSGTKVFVKDSTPKRKKCRFDLFCFLDYQMNFENDALLVLIYIYILFIFIYAYIHTYIHIYFAPIQSKVNKPELRDFFTILLTDKVKMAHWG